jgi:hypothetical protein
MAGGDRQGERGRRRKGKNKMRERIRKRKDRGQRSWWTSSGGATVKNRVHEGERKNVIFYINYM